MQQALDTTPPRVTVLERIRCMDCGFADGRPVWSVTINEGYWDRGTFHDVKRHLPLCARHIEMRRKA